MKEWAGARVVRVLTTRITNTWGGPRAVVSLGVLLYSHYDVTTGIIQNNFNIVALGGLQRESTLLDGSLC